jgi:hypothetical protein
LVRATSHAHALVLPDPIKRFFEQASTPTNDNPAEAGFAEGSERKTISDIR